MTLLVHVCLCVCQLNAALVSAVKVMRCIQYPLIVRCLAAGWTLHFVLGPSLADKHVRIFVNHPAEANAGPNRHVYRELTWMNMSGIQSDCFDNFAEVVLVLSGSFNYYFTINDRYGSAFMAISL